MLSVKLITRGTYWLCCLMRVEEIAVRKVTRDEGLCVYFVGLKGVWKIMMMVVEVVLAVVMVVVSKLKHVYRKHCSPVLP